MECFSVPMFGRVFDALQKRWEQELSVTLSVLEELLTPAEMSHLTAVLQQQDSPLSDDAFTDCLRIIREEHQKSNFSGVDDLRAMQERLRKQKGYGGT